MLIRTRNRQVPLFLAAAMLLAALTVAVLPAAPAGAQEIGSPTVTVLTPALNVRSGPGTNYPVIGGLKLGASVQIVGRHSASGWWQVSFQGAKTGWVSGAASLVKVSGATDKTPEVTAPPADDGHGPGHFARWTAGGLHSLVGQRTRIHRQPVGDQPGWQRRAPNFR